MLGDSRVKALISQSTTGGPVKFIAPYTFKAEYSFVGTDADNSTVFFESQAKLPPEAGKEPIAAAIEGKSNLYAWDRASGRISLVDVSNLEKAPPGGGFAGPYDWSNGITSFGLSHGGAERGYIPAGNQRDHRLRRHLLHRSGERPALPASQPDPAPEQNGRRRMPRRRHGLHHSASRPPNAASPTPPAPSPPPSRPPPKTALKSSSPHRRSSPTTPTPAPNSPKRRSPRQAAPPVRSRKPSSSPNTRSASPSTAPTSTGPNPARLDRPGRPERQPRKHRQSLHLDSRKRMRSRSRNRTRSLRHRSSQSTSKAPLRRRHRQIHLLDQRRQIGRRRQPRRRHRHDRPGRTGRQRSEHRPRLHLRRLQPAGDRRQCDAPVLGQCGAKSRNSRRDRQSQHRRRRSQRSRTEILFDRSDFTNPLTA